MNPISGSRSLYTQGIFTPATVSVPAKGRKAAHEFEAQLIGTMLQAMEKTFASLPGKERVAGEEDYDSLGTQALSSAVEAAGGFGIARMISDSFDQAKGKTSTPAKVVP